MNMIASTTVIRGKGQCEAYMNGIVMEEMRKQNDRHAVEMAAVRASRDRLADGLIESYKRVQRESWLHRIKEKIEIAWCVFFGMLLDCVWAKFEGTCIFCPFPQGICMKDDGKKGKKKNDRQRISGTCNADGKPGGNSGKRKLVASGCDGNVW